MTEMHFRSQQHPVRQRPVYPWLSTFLPLLFRGTLDDRAKPYARLATEWGVDGFSFLDGIRNAETSIANAAAEIAQGEMGGAGGRGRVRVIRIDNRRLFVPGGSERGELGWLRKPCAMMTPFAARDGRERGRAVILGVQRCLSVA